MVKLMTGLFWHHVLGLKVQSEQQDVQHHITHSRHTLHVFETCRYTGTSSVDIEFKSI